MFDDDDYDGAIKLGIVLVAGLEAVTWILLKLDWVSWAEETATYGILILVGSLAVYALLAVFFLIGTLFGAFRDSN